MEPATAGTTAARGNPGDRAEFDRRLDATRNVLVNRIWMIAGALALVYAPIVVWRALEVGWHLQLQIHMTIAVGTLLFVASLGRVPLPWKSALLVLVFMTIGLAGMFTLGMVGTGFWWIAQSAVLVSTLHSLRAGVIATVGCGLVLVAAGFAFVNGFVRVPFDLNAHIVSASAWTSFLIVATLVPLAMMLTVGGFHKAIGDLMVDLERQRDQLAEMSERLGEALATTEKALQAKSEFLANMSHEIRTPLNGMLGIVQLLQRSPLDARDRAHVDKLRYSANTLLLVINDILDFSKIEAGKLDIDVVPFSLRELLDNVGSLLRASAGDKHLAFRLEVDPALPDRLLGDPLRIGQVLLNLGSNAVKFTERGEVRISATGVGDGERVELRIRVDDTGIGIAGDQIERLFESFQQADSSISRRFGGTGLGLAISRRLAQLMQGSISVSSTLGSGSSFEFRLELAVSPEAADPVAVLDRDVAPAAADDRPDGRALDGLRVLLVDDNPLNVDVVRALLVSEGATVITAGDGAAAVGRARAGGIDVVLMDIQMPVMDGYAATRAIRGDPATRSLPVIAMSANSKADERERSREAGVDDYIVKPFDFFEVVRLLKRFAPQAAFQPEAAQLPLIDPDVGLEFVMGDNDRYLALLAMFVNQYRDEAANAPGMNPGEYRAHLHRLSGSAALLGMSRLVAVCRATEAAADAPAVRTGLSTVLAETRRTAARLAGVAAGETEGLGAVVEPL